MESNQLQLLEDSWFTSSTKLCKVFLVEGARMNHKMTFQLSMEMTLS